MPHFPPLAAHDPAPWTQRAENRLGIAAASIVVSFVARAIGQRRRLSTSETGSV
jgi:hypothetical protein